MLTISDVTYRVGGKRGRALLDHAGVQIPEGCKLGLVGRNGIGKSTLLDLIRGRLAPDDGDIVLPRGLPDRLSWAQEAPSGRGDAARHRARGRPRAKRGCWPSSTATRRRRASPRSRRGSTPSPPAPRRRSAGAHPRRARRRRGDAGVVRSTNCQAAGGCASRWRRCCSSSPTCLLLDEPTNHLDMEASLWLERYLRRYRRSFILVSHDRQLLNAATSPRSSIWTPAS